MGLLCVEFSPEVLSLQRSTYSCSIATRSWIAETWRFLSDSKIEVMDPFDKPQLTCPNNSFLMEGFYAYGYRGGKELALLNCCRMHLHALHLSDVCMADSRHLTDNALEVQPDQQCSLPFSWPRTHRPDLQTRSLWRSALCKICRAPLLLKC